MVSKLHIAVAPLVKNQIFTEHTEHFHFEQWIGKASNSAYIILHSEVQTLNVKKEEKSTFLTTGELQL